MGASNDAARKNLDRPGAMVTMESVVARENVLSAFKRVKRNKGAAGIDKMTTEELGPHLFKHWPMIRERLLEGRYEPQPVLRTEVPKPNGGVRQLGIPTVVDRLIQQALNQVMSPIFEPGFSEYSYGFRPGRSAQQAAMQAKAHVAGGRRWVVDMDLEKFFDRVNHDILMSRVARHITDPRILGLIRKYLQAGMMLDGLVSQRVEGTPQGGPLSPLLSNVLLDELDKELERRGHKFCRYADDCNIYVRSRAAGERVLMSITEFLSRRLRLTVNQEKSAVGRPWQRKFLGYSMTQHRQPRLKIAPESLKRFKGKFRKITRKGRGRSLTKVIQDLNPLLRGWMQYFRLTEVKKAIEELDGWIRRKMRCLIWRRWKRPYTRAQNLQKRGLAQERAWKSSTNGRGPWWNAGASHMNEAFPKSYFDKLGLLSLLTTHRDLLSSY